MDAYQNFGTALVERYDGDGESDMPGLKFPIKYWEASNEPSMQHDLHTFFIGSSEDYLEILEATYQGVKAADQEAKVLHAGMAGMEPWMVSFWAPIFQKGSQYFDIANIHSIGASEELNVPEYRKLLSKYDIDKPIWVTEAQHRTGMTHDGKDISPEEHGNIITKSYVLSFALGVEKIFYTSFKAPPFATAEFQQSALINSKGEKRPAYHALETLILKVGTFTSVKKLAIGQYQFLVEGKEVYVLWGSNNIPDEIEGEVIVTDIYGKETRTTSSKISLKGSPIFLEIENGTVRENASMSKPPNENIAFRGAVMNSFPDEFKATEDDMDYAKSLGINYVSIWSLYKFDLDTYELSLNHDKDEILSAIEMAHDRGLKVLLFPFAEPFKGSSVEGIDFEGAVRNVSSDANVSAEIKAEYYSAAGTLIGTEVDIVGRLEPGKTGAFEVVYSGQQRADVKYYKIVNLQQI